MNVGKSTVIKAVQDVVESLFDLRNEYIKFPATEQETAALIRTFEEYPDLLNIAGAFDGTRIRIEASSTILLFRQWLTPGQNNFY